MCCASSDAAVSYVNKPAYVSNARRSPAISIPLSGYLTGRSGLRSPVIGEGASLGESGKHPIDRVALCPGRENGRTVSPSIRAAVGVLPVEILEFVDVLIPAGENKSSVSLADEIEFMRLTTSSTRDTELAGE